jgi:hypothetical protein
MDSGQENSAADRDRLSVDTVLVLLGIMLGTFK